MVLHKESLISAHHNYLVNDMLSAGFLLGDPHGQDAFWFLANVVPPGQTTALVSGTVFDGEARFLAEIVQGRLVRNPGGCVLQQAAGGFRIVSFEGKTILSVNTQAFTNGYLTRIQGKLYDERGELRMEPSYEGVKVYGEARLALEAPVS